MKRVDETAHYEPPCCSSPADQTSSCFRCIPTGVQKNCAPKERLWSFLSSTVTAAIWVASPTSRKSRRPSKPSSNGSSGFRKYPKTIWVSQGELIPVPNVKLFDKGKEKPSS